MSSCRVTVKQSNWFGFDFDNHVNNVYLSNQYIIVLQYIIQYVFKNLVGVSCRIIFKLYVLIGVRSING